MQHLKEVVIVEVTIWIWDVLLHCLEILVIKITDMTKRLLGGSDMI